MNQSQQKVFKVCVVGRPNVGKSTFFNLLTKTNKAIVDDRPGVTRDYLQHHVISSDGTFSYVLVDTGGFETETCNYQPFDENIVWQQSQYAIEHADLLICMFDGKSGLHIYDQDFYKLLLRFNKPTLFVVNKVDREKIAHQTAEFYQLGMDKLYLISAAHNHGVKDLKVAIESSLKAIDESSLSLSQIQEVAKIALVGRPNVGKSSLLNRLLGSQRAIVSPVAGTTRDPIDGNLRFNGQDYCILDTAGMRRRTKIDDRVEIVSSIKSYRTIQNADVVVVMIDAERGLEDQDCKIIRLAAKEFKPILIAINKWDLVDQKTTKSPDQWRQAIYAKLGELTFIPIHFMSCINNQRVHGLMKMVDELFVTSKKRIETSKLNDIIQDITQKHTPALIRSFAKRPKFYYSTQVAVRPPTIVIKCNVADKIQDSYKRYLTNQLRARLDLKGIQPKIIFRDKKEQTS